MTYSTEPVYDFMQTKHGQRDLADALNQEKVVMVKSGDCFFIMYPKKDCWYVHYAAGPLGRLSGLILVNVPYMLPFVSFHRHPDDSEPRLYRTETLLRRLSHWVKAKK